MQEKKLKNNAEGCIYEKANFKTPGLKLKIYT